MSLATNMVTFSIPTFDSSSRFPPLEILQLAYDTNVAFAKEKLVTKVFVFDSLSIADIKEKYSLNIGRKMSRGEALIGFICSRFMEATQNKNKYRVVQFVNVRTRLDPPLPMNSFGNYAVPEPILEGYVDVEDQGWFGASKCMADSTRNVNADYIKKIQNKDEQLNFFRRLYEVYSEKDVVSFIFSSLHNFPVYEIHYGWGKPLWVATTSLPVKNLVFLSSTKDGLGAEVWICLKEEDIAKLELDNLFLQHVSAQTLKLNSSRL